MTITCIFHGDLPGLLSVKSDHNGMVRHTTYRRASIKDMIESLGVPHTEIQVLRLRGDKISFEYIVQDQDRIEVYPPTPPCDVCKPSILCPDPLDSVRFVVDINVGKLAALLRMAGFDTAFPANATDNELAALSHTEKRILLTRDTSLLKRKIVTHGRLIRAIEPENQLKEVLWLYGQKNQLQPFSRCLCCNEKLVPVKKKEIEHRLLPLTKKYYHDFHQCTKCDKIFWAGSHRENMEKYLRIFEDIKPENAVNELFNQETD